MRPLPAQIIEMCRMVIFMIYRRAVETRWVISLIQSNSIAQLTFIREDTITHREQRSPAAKIAASPAGRALTEG